MLPSKFEGSNSSAFNAECARLIVNRIRPMCIYKRYYSDLFFKFDKVHGYSPNHDPVYLYMYM